MLTFALNLEILIVTGCRTLATRLGITQGLEETEYSGNNIQNDINWTLMPGKDGEVRVAFLSDLEHPQPGSGNDVYFLLWTRKNSFMAERQILNETCSPKFKYFNRERKTKVMVHGFGDAAKDSIMYPLMKDGKDLLCYLYGIREAGRKRGPSMALYFFAELAAQLSQFLAPETSGVVQCLAAPWYHLAARNTEIAAKQTASMIDYLVENAGAKIEDFHLLGFSLGAHVVGIVGQYIKSGRISHITGLDPAQVLYQSVPSNLRLDQDDADLVEVIHTSGGYLAFIEMIGHRDFFPNGGIWPQPGCVLDFVSVCSHQRAYYYLAEAIKRGSGFGATFCGDWTSYKAGMCDNNEKVPLWNDYNSSVSGRFFLDTNKEEPFSKD